MFSKLAVYALLAATVVTALPGHPGGGGGGQSGTINNTTNNNKKCNVGSLHCCGSVQKVTSANQSKLAGILGINPSNLVEGVLVGAHCNPITGIGAGATSCSASPVCCKNNKNQSLVSAQCSPVNVVV